MPSKLFKSSDYLETAEDVMTYLDAALEDDDPKFLLLALRDILDSQGGMTMMASRTGLNRESLYRTLSEEGNPKLSTLFEIIKSLGLHLSVRAA